MKHTKIIVLLLLICPTRLVCASPVEAYVKGSLGVGTFLSNKSDENSRAMPFGGKYFARDTNSVSGFAAVGYYLNDMFRVEASLGAYKLWPLENEFIPNIIPNSILTISRRTKIVSAMLGLYVNIFTVGESAFFVGGKLGMASISESVNIKFKLRGEASLDIATDREKNKRANNFAYGVSAGVALPITKALVTDISVTYNDYGKTKSIKSEVNVGGIGGVFDLGKTPYKNINLEVGLRYSF